MKNKTLCKISFLPLVTLSIICLPPATPATAADSCGIARDVAKMAAREFSRNKKKGLKLFIKAEKLCPDDPQYEYNLGIAYYSYGQVTTAIKQFKKALQQEPDNAKWQNNLAAILLTQTEKSSAAITHARKAVQLQPRMKEAHLTLIQAELAAGKYEDALQHATQAEKKWSQDKSITRLHAEALDNTLSQYLTLIESGKTEAGLAGLARLNQEPEAVRVHALTLSGLKRYEQALQVAQKGSRTFPENKELAGLFDSILDEQIRGLFLAYKAGKQAEATQGAKILHEQYPGRKNAKDAYDKLFAALIADVSDIAVPEAATVPVSRGRRSSGSYKDRLARITGASTDIGPEKSADMRLSVDVDVDIPRGTVSNPYGIAVIIGNQRYARMHKGLVDVSYAERDARVMKKYLEKVMGFKEQNIIYRENISSGDFRNIFGSKDNPRGMLHNYIRRGESEVFIYYSGHGAPGPNGSTSYLVPVDATADYIANNGYDLHLFYNVLEKLPAKKVTVVIDSCFSGDSEAGLLFKNISPAMLKNAKPVRTIKNTVIFASADRGQVSTWYPAKRHSTFSYFFFKGIGGEADSNRDKQITVSEMGEYLGKEVRYYAQRLSNRKQTPLVVGDGGEVLAKLR